MTKKQYLKELGRELRELKNEEREKSLAFYSEMIDDRVESGMTEEAAIMAMDTPKAAAEKVLSEADGSQKSRVWSPAAKTLAVAGSPLWFPVALALAIAMFAVIFALVVAAFAIVIAFYASSVSLGIAGCACLIASVAALAISPADMMMVAGAGLVLLGLGVAFFVGTMYMTRGFVWLFTRLFALVGRLFKRKDDVE